MENVRFILYCACPGQIRDSERLFAPLLSTQMIACASHRSRELRGSPRIQDVTPLPSPPPPMLALAARNRDSSAENLWYLQFGSSPKWTQNSMRSMCLIGSVSRYIFSLNSTYVNWLRYRFHICVCSYCISYTVASKFALVPTQMTLKFPPSFQLLPRAVLSHQGAPVSHQGAPENVERQGSRSAQKRWASCGRRARLIWSSTYGGKLWTGADKMLTYDGKMRACYVKVVTTCAPFSAHVHNSPQHVHMPTVSTVCPRHFLRREVPYRIGLNNTKQRFASSPFKLFLRIGS